MTVRKQRRMAAIAIVGHLFVALALAVMKPGDYAIGVGFALGLVAALVVAGIGAWYLGTTNQGEVR